MKFRLFYLDYPFKKRRIYLQFPSVLTGDFNHFEHKLCKTKPNSETPKMIVSNYMTTSNSNISQLGPKQKQSQTNPNEPNLNCANSWSISKQTQSKPILPALVAGKIVLSLSKGLLYSILKDSLKTIQYIYGKILTR